MMFELHTSCNNIRHSFQICLSVNLFSPPRSSTIACLLPPGVIPSLFTCHHFCYFLQSPNPTPPPFPTINVLGRFVGIVLYNHFDEVHALYNETFKGHSFPSRSEDVADSKLQRTMDEWYKRTWVVLQEI